MDREAVARAGRRVQVEEALAFEREREAALRRQVAELVLEEDGPRVDAAAFAELDDDEVRRVRAALGEPDEDAAEEDDLFEDGVYYVEFVDEPGGEDGEEDEASRLEREIDESLRTQAALERFIAALDAPAPTETR